MAERKRPQYERAEVTVQNHRMLQPDVNYRHCGLIEAAADKETSDRTKMKPIDGDLEPEQSSLISNSYRQ